MQQNTCTTVCWSTSCNIRHPLKDLGSCYCDMHPKMEQLSSYIPAMVPHTAMHGDTSMNTVSKQPTLSQVAQLHTTGSDKTPHFSDTTCIAPPAPCMQPTSAAPAKPATKMKQAPAVPATPAVQKNALAPMPATSHATPVQPQRSSCACMAPRCLVQEI